MPAESSACSRGTKRSVDATFIFRTEAESSPGVAVLRLFGALDAHTVPEFEAAAAACFGGGARLLVLDLAQLRYVSSAGFGALLEAHHDGRAVGCRLVAANVPMSIDRIFGTLGLHLVLERIPTVEAALEAFNATFRNP